MRAALIAHRSDCDPGFVGIALRERGYCFVEYMREDSAVWSGQIDEILNHVDLVVSLGSGWSTYWPAVADHVVAEAQLLREAHRRQVPILGICFGAQMLSTALGGSVDKAATPEVGWYQISPVTPSHTEDGPDRALVSNVMTPAPELPPETWQGPWMQWHYDAFSVPDGFYCYATSSAGPQIIHSQRSVGVQFHPEATESIVARWSEGDGQDELAALGIDPEELCARTRHEAPSAARRCDALVEWFLATIA